MYHHWIIGVYGRYHWGIRTDDRWPMTNDQWPMTNDQWPIEIYKIRFTITKKWQWLPIWLNRFLRRVNLFCFLQKTGIAKQSRTPQKISNCNSNYICNFSRHEEHWISCESATIANAADFEKYPLKVALPVTDRAKLWETKKLVCDFSLDNNL